MPSAVFDPLKAVSVQSNILLDPDGFGVLQGEQYLLIHGCVCRGSRKTFEDHDKDGKLIMSVKYDPRLRWSIDADALGLFGLANYHPGAALSTEALTFANGASHPFLFENETGVYVYEDPVSTPEAGGLVGIDFDIELIFGGLSASPPPEAPAFYSSFVSTGTYPYAPSAYASVPAQTVVEFSTTALNAFLLDLWNGIPAFDDSEPVTMQCLTSGNVALTAALATGAWTTPVVGSSAWIYKSSSPALDFNNTSLSSRTVAKVRVARGGLTLRDVTLAAPLVVPAGEGIRLPAGAISLQWTYPLDSTLPPASQLPANVLIPYVLGGLRSTYSLDDDVLVHAAETLTGSFDIFPVPRTSTYWTVAGLTVTPVAVTGVIPADPGGWDVTNMSVLLHTASNVFLCRELVTLNVPEDTLVEFDGAPVLDLAAAPD